MRGTEVAIVGLAALLISGCHLIAQDAKDDGSIPIVLHVTSVTKDEPPDYCTTGQCMAERYTVEGYSRVQDDAHYTQFVLKCVEVTALSPTAHVTIECARLRANANYEAKLFADAVFFIDEVHKNSDSTNGPLEAGFDIVSQREVVKP